MWLRSHYRPHHLKLQQRKTLGTRMTAEWRPDGKEMAKGRIHRICYLQVAMQVALHLSNSTVVKVRVGQRGLAQSVEGMSIFDLCLLIHSHHFFGRRKGQLAQSGQGGMGGGGGSGGSFPGQAGTGQFYGGAMPYNSQGMMMNRNGQNSQFPAGYGGMRNMAPQMQMYMNPMGMQRMMPNWPGRPMMMPIAPGQGQNWDDGRESSYESSRSSRFSGSRSRSRGRSLSRNRSRSRSRDRDRRRGGGRSRDTRDTRRDDRYLCVDQM
jgi:hypothetical protein